ncbi:hypothetical protein K2173_024043 [Erythroxylum novogranatense]|uniref:DNA-directed RNA polymerase III subunit n=1 Tax=Erythroxylum novogranatense TaxID=1862640 RepID=A0AAV8TQ39_9ROSI|nr:hypothetical protein K2173_024043 [Erythroxylum novogranatense]
MSFRGRGRGYHGRSGFGGFSKQEPFVLFPEVELPDPKDVKDEKTLVTWNFLLQRFFKASPYHLKETSKNVSSNSESMDIQRFCDMMKPKVQSERDSLEQILQLGSKNFPKELVEGSRLNRKKLRWNTGSDLEKLDLFEKLEQKIQGKEEKGEREKEEEDEEVQDEELEAEDEISDDDYNQNVDFDDDEDDYNMDDENDDGPTY